MMKKSISLCTLLFALLLTGCNERLNAPELPAVDSDVIPAAIPMDAARIPGLWVSTDSLNRYVIEFTDVTDSMAIVSHYFTNATNGMSDSIVGRMYQFSYKEGDFMLTPSADAQAKGSMPMHAVHAGEQILQLFVTHPSGYCNQICQLNRQSGPIPVIMAVNRTLPKAGEMVVVSGRNLQNVDHLYLPTFSGWYEIVEKVVSSRSIQFVMPVGDFCQGSIRCQVSEDKLSVYSPAYMFAHDGIMMHSFSENGTTKADHYAGSEFEFSIKDLGQLKQNVYTPGDKICFFGETAIAWPVATGKDDKKGYLRFSTGDRLKTILERYEASGNALITKHTPCSDLALQMDIYVESNGNPIWNTGYISFRLNKDRTEGEAVANVLGWNKDQPMNFSDGWQTFTIPLQEFAMTRSLRLEQLINTLLSGNLQTILTIMNYPLGEHYPATALDQFQFSIADIRLVPITNPINTPE